MPQPQDRNGITGDPNPPFETLRMSRPRRWGDEPTLAIAVGRAVSTDGPFPP